MPGVLSGHGTEYVNYNESNAEEMLELIRDDLEYWGYPRNYIVECGETDMPPEGYYKIALRYDTIENKGFHFLRQVSDKNGAWMHKNGEGPVENDDDNGNLIYNPRKAVIRYHEYFVCYYAVKSIDYTFD